MLGLFKKYPWVMQTLWDHGYLDECIDDLPPLRPETLPSKSVFAPPRRHALKTSLDLQQQFEGYEHDLVAVNDRMAFEHVHNYLTNLQPDTSYPVYDLHEIDPGRRCKLLCMAMFALKSLDAEVSVTVNELDIRDATELEIDRQAKDALWLGRERRDAALLFDVLGIDWPQTGDFKVLGRMHRDEYCEVLLYLPVRFKKHGRLERAAVKLASIRVLHVDHVVREIVLGSVDKFVLHNGVREYSAWVRGVTYARMIDDGEYTSRNRAPLIARCISNLWAAALQNLTIEECVTKLQLLESSADSIPKEFEPLSLLLASDDQSVRDATDTIIQATLLNASSTPVVTDVVSSPAPRAAVLPATESVRPATESVTPATHVATRHVSRILHDLGT